MFDDRLHHPLPVANDPSIAAGIGQVHSEKCELLWGDLLQKTFQRRRLDQRHITIKDQHTFGRKCRERLGHCMPCPQLLGLHHKIQIIRSQLFANLLGAVADDHVDGLWRECASGIDDMPKHGSTRYGMENFR